jgi:hypothetical protein
MPSPPYKISSKSTNRFKSCAHLRNLNVLHFETVEATGFNTIESMSLLMSSPPYKMSSKSTERFKSYYGIYLHPPQKFKRPHLGIAEATRLKMCYRSYLERQFLPVKFHINPPLGSKVIIWGPTDRHIHTQTDRLVI